MEDTPRVGVLTLAVPRSDQLVVLSLARRKVADRPGVSRRVARTLGDLIWVLVSAVPRVSSGSWLVLAVSS